MDSCLFVVVSLTSASGPCFLLQFQSKALILCKTPGFYNHHRDYLCLRLSPEEPVMETFLPNDWTGPELPSVGADAKLTQTPWGQP